MAIDLEIRGGAARDATAAARQPGVGVADAVDAHTDASSRSGWVWATDWGPAWDSPDVVVMDYVGSGEVRDVD